MSTFGNLALRQGNDTKHKMMVEYLSAEDGYWYKNDKWRADTAAYKKTGLRDVRFPDEAIVDFSGYQNEWLKLEVKYE